MRNLMLIVIFIGFGSVVFGQEYAIDKGASIISGMGSFTSSGGDLFEDERSNRTMIVSFAPAYNHFVKKNFFIGGGFEFSYQSQGTYSTNAIGIGPQIGYAFGDITSTTFAYLATGIHYYSMTTNGSYSDSETAGFDAFLGFGIIAPLKTHVGLTFEAGYHILTVTKNAGASTGNVFSFGVGIVGLLY